MRKLRTLKIEGNFILGGVTTITAFFDYDLESGDTVKITIEDPLDTTKVDEVAMTELTDNIYQYIYQSASADEDGDYLITVEAESGSYDIVYQKTFNLLDKN